MTGAFLPRFLVWLVRELLLHFALAYPGLLFLRFVSLGRWPRIDEEGKHAQSGPDRRWFSRSVAAGALLWSALGLVILWKVRS